MAIVADNPQSTLLVKKFGGTSVGSLSRIEAVADSIAAAHRRGEQQVIVCSAMAGETNRLYAMAQQLDGAAEPRELDMLVSTGEQVSVALMAIALQKRGIAAASLAAWQLPLVTLAKHGGADIERVETERLRQLLAQGIVPVVAGFQGVSATAEITTLGRGGSDTTAVAIAAALQADECQIFTDVDGVYTTDPAIEHEARRLATIGFRPMLALAQHGAKVLHPESVAIAYRYQMRLRVLSSFATGPGTLVVMEHPTGDAKLVGIALQKDVALLRCPDSQDVAAFDTFVRQQIPPQVLTADCEAGRGGSHWFLLAQSQANKCIALLEQSNSAIAVICAQSLHRLTLVAEQSDAVAACAQLALLLLQQAGIVVHHRHEMGICCTILVAEADSPRAIRALHHGFGLNKVSQNKAFSVEYY